MVGNVKSEILSSKDRTLTVQYHTGMMHTGIMHTVTVPYGTFLVDVSVLFLASSLSGCQAAITATSKFKNMILDLNNRSSNLQCFIDTPF